MTIFRFLIYLGGLAFSADEAKHKLGALYRFGKDSETPFSDITELESGGLFFPNPYSLGRFINDLTPFLYELNRLEQANQPRQQTSRRIWNQEEGVCNIFAKFSQRAKIVSADLEVIKQDSSRCLSYTHYSVCQTGARKLQQPGKFLLGKLPFGTSRAASRNWKAQITQINETSKQRPREHR